MYSSFYDHSTILSKPYKNIDCIDEINPNKILRERKRVGPTRLIDKVKTCKNTFNLTCLWVSNLVAHRGLVYTSVMELRCERISCWWLLFEKIYIKFHVFYALVEVMIVRDTKSDKPKDLNSDWSQTLIFSNKSLLLWHLRH